MRRWRVAVDRGGTFTDLVLRGPRGEVVVRKVPSVGDAGEDPAVTAIREVVGAPPGEPIPASLVASVRCGTTVATNALLERRGERCALLVTRGFADLLAIGTQERPELFELAIRRATPLPERTVEIDERVLADGSVRRALDPEEVRRAADELLAAGFRSVAVLFLHAALHPRHEQAAGAVLRGAGFPHVVLSHEAAREVKALPRGETAAADAYLTPVLRRALDRFRAAFDRAVDVRFLESHGGVADARRARGPEAVLSGPAGGALAVGEVARLAGEPRVVGFDMGGTSTDVSRWAGEVETVYETRAAGLRLQVPALRIVTVAAGGGSILRHDGRRLHVGPESAGADPGPAGYGRGGPPTLTDANAVLGRLLPGVFPRCFGPDGRSPFDAAAARRAIAPLAEAAGLSVEAAAEGFLTIANERMAQAIREVSVARGHDVRDHALVCFGGAGPQHACAVASALGARSVLVHPLASVLSAWGVGGAATAVETVRAVPAALGDEGARLAAEALDALGTEALAALALEGVEPERAATRRTVELRRRGVDATIAVEAGDASAMRARFEAEHARLYGFGAAGDVLEIVNARVRAEGRTEPWDPAADVPGAAPAGEERSARVWFRGAGQELAPRSVRVLDGSALRAGDAFEGPLLVVDAVTTVVVEPGWRLTVEAGRLLRLVPTGAPPRRRIGTARDPVALALLGNAFMSVAERMGSVLERVSHSTNIKERLDFSCAVFDAEGRLVANAPHIPVHLGAMGESVRAVAASRGSDLREGDAILTNDPHRGGSHLPDVTVVTPVRVRDGRAAFFVANRAHHADVGGVSPGSMPALSRRLDEEGVCLHALLLVRDGALREAEVRAAFASGPFPARAPDERIADLRAQAAANAEGARLLAALCAEHGEEVVSAYMGHVLDDGAEAVEELLRSREPGTRSFADLLDDGTPLRVAVTVGPGRAVVDFGGTGPRSAGNLNAPRAVTRAAVLYAFRTLFARPLPLNEGCLRPIEIRIPAGSLLDPAPGDAVVGGNVETSMRIVDLVLGALGACAASQGTMNNVAFGTADRAYYETLGGGSGAGPGFDGASAVQVHMTNTRITDPEVLESRWPVVLRRFAIRRGSGGRGAHRGGDGAVREIEFLAPFSASVLSERRRVPAFGLLGGGPGALGRNLLLRDGEETELPGRASLELLPGDVLRIETPGGGGYGAAGTEPA